MIWRADDSILIMETRETKHYPIKFCMLCLLSLLLIWRFVVSSLSEVKRWELSSFCSKLLCHRGQLQSSPTFQHSHKHWHPVFGSIIRVHHISSSKKKRRIFFKTPMLVHFPFTSPWKHLSMDHTLHLGSWKRKTRADI